MLVGYPVVNYFVLPSLLALAVIYKSDISLKLKSVHEWAFLTLCIYMFCHTIFGVVDQQDIRILIFSAFFVSVFFLMLWVRSQLKEASLYLPLFLNTLGLASLYALIYLAIGVTMLFVSGNQFRGQGYGFVGSTVAIIPIFAALFTLPILAQAGENLCRQKPALLLFSSCAIAILYESRSLAAIVFSIAIAMVCLGKSKFFLKNALLSVAVLATLIGGVAIKYPQPAAVHILPLNLMALSVDLFKSNSTATSIFQERDAGRFSTFEVSWTATLETNPVFGNGWYSSKEGVKPFYYRIKGKKSAKEGAASSPLYLAAFHALLFDTGLLGILLMLFNLALSILQVVKRTSLMVRLYAGFFFITILGFSVVGQCQIMPIYYLFFMPNGLMFLIASSSYTRECS